MGIFHRIAYRRMAWISAIALLLSCESSPTAHLEDPAAVSMALVAPPGAGPAFDTYLKQGKPNKNQGGEEFLRIRKSGKNRVLVQFDSAQIAAAVGTGTLDNAQLVLTISDNGNNWGATGRLIDAHRLTQPWTEEGATWNCAIDDDTSNQRPDCSTGNAWDQRPNGDHPWIGPPTDSALITNDLEGAVAFDVTQDVLAMLDSGGYFGWILRKRNEGKAGRVEFHSSQATSGVGPELILQVTTPDPIVVQSHQKIAQGVGGFTGPLHVDGLFGARVASIGDLDGDGIPDIAVGAPQNDEVTSNRGAVWILLMNADGTVKGQHKISAFSGGFTGTLDNGDLFGHGLAPLGDMDGNGVSDLAVGAHRDADGGSQTGAIWILFLDTTTDGQGNVTGVVVDHHQKISDTQGGFGGAIDNSDNFSIGMSELGDLDGDGVPDLAVGAYRDDDGGLDRGAVWILFLNPNGTVKSFEKISSVDGIALADGDNFGIGVQALGDVNGDGITDLAVGADRDDDGGTNTGAVWIVFLNANGTAQGFQKISTLEGGFTGAIDAGDFFGRAVGELGDVNGDAIVDLVVGADFDDDGGPNTGAAWIIFLNSDGTVQSHRKISDTEGGFTGVLEDGQGFGVGIGGLDDLNGDGRRELAVGGYLDSQHVPIGGAVWVLFLEDLAAGGS